jgi:hypothetical protein
MSHTESSNESSTALASTITLVESPSGRKNPLKRSATTANVHSNPHESTPHRSKTTIPQPFQFNTSSNTFQTPSAVKQRRTAESHAEFESISSSLHEILSAKDVNELAKCVESPNTERAYRNSMLLTSSSSSKSLLPNSTNTTRRGAERSTMANPAQRINMYKANTGANHTSTYSRYTESVLLSARARRVVTHNISNSNNENLSLAANSMKSAAKLSTPSKFNQPTISSTIKNKKQCDSVPSSPRAVGILKF